MTMMMFRKSVSSSSVGMLRLLGLVSGVLCILFASLSVFFWAAVGLSGAVRSFGSEFFVTSEGIFSEAAAGFTPLMS